jgi:hypothetical protein
MAAVKCTRCGAVITARIIDAAVQLSHGADFISKCRELKTPESGDFIVVATECGAMKLTVQRVSARMLASHAARERRRIAAVAAPAPSVAAPVVVEPQGEASPPSTSTAG